MQRMGGAGNSGSSGWRTNLALLLLASIAGLALLEVGVRLGAVETPGPTGYAPVLTDLRFGRPRNAQGYRDVEHALAKPPGTRRLLVIGDSFAWGAGIEFEDTWGQRLGRRLQQRRQETWEVVSLALPGLAANDYAAQLVAEGMAYAPDLVIVGWVLNDAEGKQQMKDRERRYAERAARPRSFFESSALVRFARRRFEARAEARERVAYHAHLYDPDNPGWAEARLGLKSMGGACRARGLPWVVAIFPMFGNPLDERYPFAAVHEQVQRAAEEAGARVIDLLPAYRGLDWRLLVVNGAADEHPNEIAHRIAADVLLRALDDVIPPSARTNSTTPGG